MIPAVTPNAENHESLGDQASRFVNVDDLPWEDSIFDGVTFKTHLIDKESGIVTAYLRMEPGASLPDHEHMLIEQTYVMEGSLKCGEGECTAGNFVWRPAGVGIRPGHRMAASCWPFSRFRTSFSAKRARRICSITTGKIPGRRRRTLPIRVAMRLWNNGPFAGG